MITIEQCRAARGLLGWTQQDLADACGLSKTAINNFEKGHSDIKMESLNAVQMAFESMDIEFLAHQGLRKRTDNVKIIKGPNVKSQLLDDIYYTLKNTGGEVLITNTNSNRPPQGSPKNLKQQHARLKEVGITQRVIHNEGNDNEWNDVLENCQTLERPQASTAMTSFIYGEKVALEMWNQEIIIIIDSADTHASEQGRFEYLWQHSTPSTKAGDKETPATAEN